LCNEALERKEPFINPFLVRLMIPFLKTERLEYAWSFTILATALSKIV